jgi:hypothetical protein
MTKVCGTLVYIGLVELRQIMDLVYGGPPNNDKEKLNKPSWR